MGYGNWCCLVSTRDDYYYIKPLSSISYLSLVMKTDCYLCQSLDISLAIDSLGDLERMCLFRLFRCHTLLIDMSTHICGYFRAGKRKVQPYRSARNVVVTISQTTDMLFTIYRHREDFRYVIRSKTKQFFQNVTSTTSVAKMSIYSF